MTKETKTELYSIINAIDYFWYIEENKAVKQELYEVIQKLDALYEDAHATL